MEWKRTGVNCIGIKDPEGKFIINPPDDTQIITGMKIILLGSSHRAGLACRAGIHCSSCPEPLLIKDIKVQVNKQKLKIVCPAQMKHNSDKMPNCSNVQPALQQTQCWWQPNYLFEFSSVAP